MTEQINLRVSDNLLDSAKKYVKKYGYSNIQDLLKEALREKIFPEISMSYLKKRVSESKNSKRYTRKDLGF